MNANDWAMLTGADASRVGVLVATEADIAALDLKVRQLIADTDAPGQFAKLPPPLVSDWLVFRADWAQFFADHSGGAAAIPLIIQQDVTDKFVDMTARYNSLLARIRAAGVSTVAKQSGPQGSDMTLLDRLSLALGVTPTTVGVGAGIAGAVAVLLLAAAVRK